MSTIFFYVQQISNKESFSRGRIIRMDSYWAGCEADEVHTDVVPNL